MNVLESIQTALSGILSNKMRSLLTMFGIIVGISSVIMIVSVGEGFKRSMNAQFEDMGINNISLYVDGSSENLTASDDLTYDDVEYLRNYEDLEAVTGTFRMYLGQAVQLMDINETRDVFIYGVDTDYFIMNNVKLADGRYCSERDLKQNSNVIIIDEDFALQIFGKTDVLGEAIDVNSYWGTVECAIIGLVESTPNTQMQAMYNRNATVYMPITALTQNFWGTENIDELSFKVKDGVDLDTASDNVVRLIEIKHETQDKYATWGYAEIMAQSEMIINIFTMFLGFVASISLLVGGIGVMNIMLVSVTERTKEIGIRKSLGATRRNIRFQFLVEAVVLTGLGGALGLLLGYGGGNLLSMLASMATGNDISPYISINAVLLVIAISSGIGILFGVYPAGRAAKLDPIDALGFEN